jgi:hypothetical protein
MSWRYCHNRNITEFSLAVPLLLGIPTEHRQALEASLITHTGLLFRIRITCTNKVDQYDRLREMLWANRNRAGADHQWILYSLGAEEVRGGFGQVLSDSRCPVDAVCVWQGNAEVEVGIRAGMGPTIPLRMNTTLDPRFVDWQGIRVTLLELMPAPRTDVRLRPEDYSVRLKLEPLD